MMNVLSKADRHDEATGESHFLYWVIFRDPHLSKRSEE